MSVCPSCNQSTSDPGAFFCAYCGFALPEASAESESFPACATGAQPFPPDALRTRRSPHLSRASEANPNAVAVGLGALLMAVVLAIVLSYGSGFKRPAVALRHPRNAVRAPPAEEKLATNASPSALPTHLKRYRTTGYPLAYPSSWRVSRRDQPVSSYRETVLESPTGVAKVTLDYSPGETIDPASKASHVEAATSRTPGYRRISYGPTTINGRAAFAWEFMVADSDPRRADLFITTPSGGFALLAYGLDFVRAKSAARSIASALS
jgi:hypothetical protein